jgi:ribosome maturation factor RimP
MTDSALTAEVRRQVEALGYELVEFRTAGPPQHLAIQVRIDRPGSRPGFGVTAEDCTRVSRALERYLEGTGVVGPRYQLQVSSPGIERPVRFPEHWRRYAGRTVKLTARGVPGHPRAAIVDLPDEAHVRLRLPAGEELVVALDDVKEALLLEEQSDDTGPAARGRRPS